MATCALGLHSVLIGGKCGMKIQFPQGIATCAAGRSYKQPARIVSIA
jgi:hypothetical protein